MIKINKTVLIILALVCSFSFYNAQVLLQENFTNAFNPSAAGWITQNESSSIGVRASWFQGDSTSFPAYNGLADDYFAANYENLNNVGDISNWLITPTVTIYNGAVLEFATRTANVLGLGIVFAPDRLQVRMSTAGVTSSVALNSGPTSVGTFTDVLLDINPNLTTNVASAVNNGTVNGYPLTWTVYSLQISGVTGTVTGKFAFRYFVTNGGNNGANSTYIGIDAVKYSLPCGSTLQSYTTCAGITTTLTAQDGLPATTYSWNTGATSSSIIVNPSATTVYSLFSGVNGGLCPNVPTSTITIGSNLSVNFSASSTTICQGNALTISALSAGSSYLWSNGATSSAINVTPAATTIYTLGVSSGSCIGNNSITITVDPLPVLTATFSPACIGNSVTILAGGATTYTFLNSTTNPQTIPCPTVAQSYYIYVSGTNSLGCSNTNSVTFAVNANPTVTATTPNAIVCINSAISLFAQGANSYSWSGAATSTNSSFTYTNGSVPANLTFSVVGTDLNGCSATAVKTVTVSDCTAIENTFTNASELLVFPNPFMDKINISGVSGGIELYNAMGQKIISTNIIENGVVNTSEISKGLYVLKVYSNHGKLLNSIKLIKY